MKMLKNLTIVFGLAVVGIVVSFGMSIYTAVKQHQEIKTLTEQTHIPVPATQ